jgi:hypothetical protein
MNTFTIGTTYRISFPQGSSKNMTLQHIHDPTEDYQTKYTFLDDYNTKIHFTQRMIKNKRLNILEIFTESSYSHQFIRPRIRIPSVSREIEKYYEFKSD